MMEFTKGNIVRIGNGSQYWQIAGFTANGEVILIGMSREFDGTFTRTRYIPGRVNRKVVPVEWLTRVGS